MKKTRLLAIALISIPVALYAAATLKTESGFFYPTNKTFANSNFIGFGEPNEAVGNACHLANDYDDPIGTDVYSIGPGVVESASTSTPFYGSAEGTPGGTIVIRHTKSDDTFFYALYGHIQNFEVSVGDTVESGQKIAEIGSYTVGGIELSHLHFGINTAGPNVNGYTQDATCADNRNFVDPEAYIINNSPKLSASQTCTAVDDSFDTTINTILTTASVLSNDTDTDNDILSVASVDATSTLGVSILNNNDGTFTYTPPIDFTGIDTFNYTVTDNNGCTNEGTVTVTINDNATDPVDTTDTDNSDSGGGNMSIWSLFFLSLLLIRRRFRHK